ncbi:MAG: flavodoxin family protein [Desulfobacteraceae bacterium]|jgi:multimeric flavodoxin WrbA
MSKKIFIVSASPRKGGNSDFLCDEFMRGALEAGHDVEKIRVAEKEINYCTGCCACVGNQDACVQKDDVNSIMKKVVVADVLVLATPVYFHSMNAQMKTFIDRVCPFYSMISNKDVYFIISAAGGSGVVESTVKSLRQFTECLSNITERGVISVTGVWDVGGVNGTPAVKQAFDAGRNA